MWGKWPAVLAMVATGVTLATTAAVGAAPAAKIKEAPAALGATIATLTAASPISAGQGWLIWSAPEDGGWKLDAYHEGRVSTLSPPPRPQPFDATVGTDAHGKAVATFSLCTGTPKMVNGGGQTSGVLEVPSTGKGCRIHVLELASGREFPAPVPHPARSSDTTPAMWHGILAFSRREPRHGQVSQLLAWSPRHPRALLALPHGFVPSRCDICGGRRIKGAGEVQALAFNGPTLAFVWAPGSYADLGSEPSWEYRVDTVSSRRGREVGVAGTGEGCTGPPPGAPIEETYPSPPFLLGSAAHFPALETGYCYEFAGAGMLLAHATGQLEAQLTAPVVAWASDGHNTYALVAQKPDGRIGPRCEATLPCTLRNAALPAFSPVRHRLGHYPFS